MDFNLFGATEAQVLTKYATGGYAPTAADFGGSPAVADAIASAAYAVVQAMPPRLLSMLQFPDLQLIEARAADGQTTATLGQLPAVAGKCHIWAGAPQAFASKPVLVTSPWLGDVAGGYQNLTNPTPIGALVELPESGFTLNPTTGLVTLAVPLSRGWQVYASYEVAITDPTFSLPSVADIVADGAAADLGAKVYPQASSEWAYVARIVERWTNALAEIGAGRLVPTELRARQWWREPDRTQEGSIGSVRRYRG